MCFILTLQIVGICSWMLNSQLGHIGLGNSLVMSGTIPLPEPKMLHRGSWGMDKRFHPTPFHECNYLAMLRLK